MSRTSAAESEPRWRRPSLSPSERKAEPILGSIVEHNDSRILPGFKLSQVIRDRPAGVTDEQWRYATRAHFDFLVCDAVSTVPDFAIELDDPTHLTTEAQRRDRMKDAVCEAAGFELLRIESSALYPGPRGRRLAEYLIDARSYSHAFAEAQEAGHVPYDEIGDYRLIIDRTPDGRHLDLVNDLALPARLAARSAQERGQITRGTIHGMNFSWKDGWAEGWAWLHAKDDLYFFERVRLRSYHFWCGIGAGELAADLAVAAVGEKLKTFASNEAVLVRSRQIAQALARLWATLNDIEDPFMIDHVDFDDTVLDGPPAAASGKR